MEGPPSQLNPIFVGIERTQRCILVLVSLEIVAILVFSEINCLLRRICHNSDDIDIPPIPSHLFLPLLLVSLLLSVLAYEASEYVHSSCLKTLRFLLLFWSLVILGLTTVYFVTGMILNDPGDRDEVWTSLSALGQEYYDDDEDNLIEEYKVNITLVFLSQLIVGLLLFCIGIASWILYGKAPQGYIPLSSGSERNLAPLARQDFPEDIRSLEEREFPEKDIDEAEAELHPLSPPEDRFSNSEIEMQNYNP